MSDVKERPLLFSPPMIRALLEGRKTQTRRIVKPQPISQGMMSFGEAWKWNEGGEGWFSGVTAEQIANPNYGLIKSLPCPYGMPGDRLWVKESYSFTRFWEAMGIDDWAATVHYPADGADRQIYQCDAPDDVGFWPGAVIRKYEGKRLPSIFMYRWVSRITLEVTDVRVQRLKDISEEDALAEGIVWRTGPRYSASDNHNMEWDRPTDAYRELWESINGKDSWEKNPWVWIVEFGRVDGRL